MEKAAIFLRGVTVEALSPDCSQDELEFIIGGERYKELPAGKSGARQVCLT